VGDFPGPVRLFFDDAGDTELIGGDALAVLVLTLVVDLFVGIGDGAASANEAILRLADGGQKTFGLVLSLLKTNPRCIGI